MRIKAITLFAAIALLLGGLFISSEEVYAAQRKRPHLNEEKTTFVGDNDQPLRGPYTSTEWTPAVPYEQIEGIKKLGFNAVHLYAECFDINYPNPGSTAPGYAVNEVDKIVEATRELGLYLVITIGNGANNGNYNLKYAEDFWSIYAKRYADESHVLFEIHNEPVAWGPPYSSPYATPTGAVGMQISVYKIIRKYAPDTPVLLFSYAVPSGKSGANDAMKDIRIFNKAVFGDENAVWTNEAVAFHGYSGWKLASEFVASMVSEGYPCFMTEFAGGSWGSGKGGLDAEMAYQLEHLGISWLTFQYIPPTGVSDNVALPEHFSAIVENTGLSWKPDYGDWPALRGIYGNDGLPRKTKEFRVGDSMTGTTHIEAEDFDWGADGISYHDSTAKNMSGKYRPDEAVDIEECGDEGGGYNITHVKAGEWLEYTIWVQNPGYFDISLRVACQKPVAVQISSSGQDKSGRWELASTGGDGMWATQSRPIYLDYGIQRLRITFLSDDIKLNWFELAPVKDGPIPDGTYKLLNRATGLAMNKEADKDIVTLSGYSGADEQNWFIMHTGGGHYKLSSKGKWWSMSNRVIIVPVGNGYYRLIDVEKGLNLQTAKEGDSYVLGSAPYSGADSQQWAIFDTDAPAIPSGLNATIDLSGQAGSLSWDSMSGASSYVIKRSTSSGGPYKTIASGVEKTSYLDTTISAGSKYYYVIIAITAEGESLISAESRLRFPELTGSIIGTDGSWSNSGNTKHKVFDKDINSFFDSPSGNGSWAGLDFGSETKYVISHISYCPRADFPGRMIGGVFQGANQADFSDAVTLYTITEQPAAAAFTTVEIDNKTAFRYFRYLSPNDGYGNVAEIEVFGYAQTGAQADRQSDMAGEMAGDVFPDGQIDTIDLIVLKKHLMGIEKIQNEKPADLNSDGCIDALDYAIMKRYLAGTIASLPELAEIEINALSIFSADNSRVDLASEGCCGSVDSFDPLLSAGKLTEIAIMPDRKKQGMIS